MDHQPLVDGHAKELIGKLEDNFGAQLLVLCPKGQACSGAQKVVAQGESLFIQTSRIRPYCKTCNGSFLVGYVEGARSQTTDVPSPTSWTELLTAMKKPIACRSCCVNACGEPNGVRPDGVDEDGPYKKSAVGFNIFCNGCRSVAPPLPNLVPWLPRSCSCCPGIEPSCKYMLAWGCGHFVCLDCFDQYFEAAANQKKLPYDQENCCFSIGCPVGCPGKMLQNHQLFKLLGDTQMTRFRSYAAKAGCERLGGVVCPLPDCSAIFEIQPNSQHHRHVPCRSCKDWFCRSCKSRTQLCDCVQEFVPITSVEPIEEQDPKYFIDCPPRDTAGVKKCTFRVLTPRERYVTTWPTTPVGYIKVEVAKLLGGTTNPDQFRLLFCGKALRNSMKTSDFFKADNTVVDLHWLAEIRGDAPKGGSHIRDSAAQALGKKCPRCPRYVLHEQNDGTHKVKCRPCDYTFCYLCKEVWPDDQDQCLSRCPLKCPMACPCPTKKAIFDHIEKTFGPGTKGPESQKP